MKDGVGREGDSKRALPQGFGREYSVHVKCIVHAPQVSTSNCKRKVLGVELAALVGSHEGLGLERRRVANVRTVS